MFQTDSQIYLSEIFFRQPENHWRCQKNNHILHIIHVLNAVVISSSVTNKAYLSLFGLYIFFLCIKLIER